MKNLKYIPEQIMWHDGMLLSPQHFQQAFKRSENIPFYHIFQNCPYPYGIKTFKYDKNFFANGILKIEELECIFQDGLTYYYNCSIDNFSLEYNLTQYKELLDSKKYLTIYLCNPKSDIKNFTANKKYTKYNSTQFESHCYDENTGDDEIYIPRIKPQVFFFIEQELTPQFNALPIAKIFIENSFYKSFPFALPTTFIQKNSLVWEICNTICQIIRYKIQDILEDIAKYNSEVYESSYIKKLLLLKSLKSSIPLLEATINSKKVHPFFVYLQLYNTYGQIISNDFDEKPQLLIEYDHFNMLICFEKIKKNIIEFLEKEVPSGFSISKLIKIDNKFKLTLNLQNDTLDNHTHILLGFKKNYSSSSEQFEQWIKSAIICEEEDLDLSLERRSLGYSRSIIKSYEGLVSKRNIYLTYVKIENFTKEQGAILISPSTHDSKANPPDEIYLYSRKIK